MKAHTLVWMLSTAQIASRLLTLEVKPISRFLNAAPRGSYQKTQNCAGRTTLKVVLRVGSTPSKNGQPSTKDLSPPTSLLNTRLPVFTGLNEADLRLAIPLLEIMHTNIDLPRSGQQTAL